ncbi:MAG: MFS transporter [Planctomycetota bacterium]|nr:MFS transporter [Planctomycetota bacterium]
MNPLLPVTILGLFVGGLAASILGTVKLPLARKLQLGDDRIGGLMTAFSAPFLPVVLATGWLVDRFGCRTILIVAAVGIAAGLWRFSAARRYASVLAAGLVFAISWAMLINVAHVLIPLAFPRPLALATNLADSCFGVGALATPLLAAAIFPRFGMERLLQLIALAAITVAVPAVFMTGIEDTLGAASDFTGSESAGTLQLLTHPMIWLCGLCLATFGPAESSFATWCTSYLVEKRFDAGFATRMLSGFWTASIVSRMVTALALPGGWEGVLLLGAAVVNLAVLLAVVISHRRAVAPLLVLAAGLCLGPVFPTVIAIVFNAFEPNVHGRVVGLTMAIGSVGYTLAPIVVGYCAKRTSMQRSFAVLLIPSVAFLLLTIVLNRPA